MVTRIIDYLFGGRRKLLNEEQVLSPIVAAVRIRPTTTWTSAHYPMVGVVTPVRNRRDWTTGFLSRMRDQSYPLIRMYIVDSASTDGTPAAIRSMGASEIELIEAPDRFYWTAATNAGVRAALEEGCDYILTLNDDAIVPNDFIENIVRSALDSEAQIVGSVISYADEPARIWAVGAYNNWESGAFVQTGLANLFEEALLSESQKADRGLIPTNYLCGNGTLVHRSVFERIGLYEEKNLPHYHADSEFTMRAEKAGISRFVALTARLYNRFALDADGPFSRKNMRFFSLRSANYARAILYILETYCPAEYRSRAFIFYYGRYLSLWTARQMSVFLRWIRFSTLPPHERAGFVRRLVPPGDPSYRAADDIEILHALPEGEFVLCAYAYFLRRACSEEEFRNYLHAVLGGKPRPEIIGEFTGSEEYRNRWQSPFGADLQLLLQAPHFKTAQSLDLNNLSDPAFVMAASVAVRGGMPKRRAFAEHMDIVGREGRDALISHLRSQTTDSKALHILKRLADRQSSTPRRDVSTNDRSITTVYVNIDVLCLGAVDPKARTGVHRYVQKLLEALLCDPRVDIRVFHSGEVTEHWLQLVAAEPKWKAISLQPEDQIAAQATTFYPFFRFGAPDRRLAALSSSLMLHDLFPLVHPEWFNAEATETFRRQTRDLFTVDHVFCNSQATLTQFRSTFPSLRVSSSVAYLAADTPVRGKGTRVRARELLSLPRGARYVVCVGTIEPRKNLLNALSAFSLLRSRPDVSNLYMVVIGQKGWNVDIETLGKHGLHSEKIRFVGRVADEQLWAIYEDAVCTVFPSLAEGFGLPIVESFAHGVPVVTSKGGCTEEIAARGGVFVDPLRPEDIAEAIYRLATDISERNRLGREAIVRARDFSWGNCADAHIVEFQRLALGEAGVRLPPRISSGGSAANCR